MKAYVVLAIAAVYSVAIIASVVLASPLNDLKSDEEKALSRSRRDLSGVFDSIANGVSGLVDGAKTVSISIQNAFNGIFSTNNKNKITNGFEQFKNGMKGAWSNLFGSNGAVSNGFKKIGDKVKGAWNGMGGSSQSTEAAQTEKSEAPEGEVPEQETT